MLGVLMATLTICSTTVASAAGVSALM